MIPRSVVFVCTGNTCRSPLAEVIARATLQEAGLGLVDVRSAGLRATEGAPAATEAVRAAAAMGLSLEAHRARTLDSLVPDARTLLLTMTPAQASEVRARLHHQPGPGGAQVAAILPYARERGAPQAPGDTVEDPLGRGPEAYRDVASLLRDAITAVVRAWAAEFAGGAPLAGRGLETKTIALPRLAGLRPTLESTALKLLEEAGELAEAIGKYRSLSGERRARPSRQAMTAVGKELLDVAQTAVTMMFVLEEQHGLSLQTLVEDHVQKLAARGYLRRDGEVSSPAGGHGG